MPKRHHDPVLCTWLELFLPLRRTESKTTCYKSPVTIFSAQYPKTHKRYHKSSDCYEPFEVGQPKK